MASDAEKVAGRFGCQVDREDAQFFVEFFIKQGKSINYEPHPDTPTSTSVIILLMSADKFDSNKLNEAWADALLQKYVTFKLPMVLAANPDMPRDLPSIQRLARDDEWARAARERTAEYAKASLPDRLRKWEDHFEIRGIFRLKQEKWRARACAIIQFVAFGDTSVYQDVLHWPYGDPPAGLAPVDQRARVAVGAYNVSSMTNVNKMIDILRKSPLALKVSKPRKPKNPGSKKKSPEKRAIRVPHDVYRELALHLGEDDMKHFAYELSLKNGLCNLRLATAATWQDFFSEAKKSAGKHVEEDVGYSFAALVAHFKAAKTKLDVPAAETLEEIESLIAEDTIPEASVRDLLKALAAYVRVQSSFGFRFLQHLFSDTIADTDALVNDRRFVSRDACRTLCRELIRALGITQEHERNLFSRPARDEEDFQPSEPAGNPYPPGVDASHVLTVNRAFMRGPKESGIVDVFESRSLFRLGGEARIKALREFLNAAGLTDEAQTHLFFRRDPAAAIRALPQDAGITDVVMRLVVALRNDLDPSQGMAQLASSPLFVAGNATFNAPSVTEAQMDALQKQVSAACLYFWATGTGKTTAMWAEVIGAARRQSGAVMVVLQKWDLITQFLTDPLKRAFSIVGKLASVKLLAMHRLKAAATSTITPASVQGLSNDRILRVSCMVDDAHPIELFLATYDTLARLGGFDFAHHSHAEKYKKLLAPFLECAHPHIVFDEAHLMRNQMAAECLDLPPFTPAYIQDNAKPREPPRARADVETIDSDDEQDGGAAFGAPKRAQPSEEAEQQDAAKLPRLEDEDDASLDGDVLDPGDALDERAFPYGMYEAVLWFLRFRWTDGPGVSARRVALLTATPVGQRPDQFFRIAEAAAFLTQQAVDKAAVLERIRHAKEMVDTYVSPIVTTLENTPQDATGLCVVFNFVSRYLEQCRVNVSVDFIDDSAMPRRNYAQSAIAVVAGGLSLREGAPVRVPLLPEGVQLQQDTNIGIFVRRQLCNGYFVLRGELVPFEKKRYKLLFKWLRQCRLRALFHQDKSEEMETTSYYRAICGWGIRGKTQTTDEAPSTDDIKIMLGFSKKAEENELRMMAANMLMHLELRSEKLELIADAVKAHSGSPTVVFCDHTTIGGAQHLELLLAERGMVEYPEARRAGARAYKTVSGKMSMRDRQRIAFNEDSFYNRHDNARGDVIACLIVLPAGHVSVTLRNTHVAHFVNMPLDVGRSVQMLGRIARRSKPEPDAAGVPTGYFAGFSISEHGLLEECETEDTTSVRVKETSTAALKNIFKKLTRVKEAAKSGLPLHEVAKTRKTPRKRGGRSATPAKQNRSGETPAKNDSDYEEEEEPVNEEYGEESSDDDESDDDDVVQWGPPGTNESGHVFKKVPMVTYTSYMSVCSSVWEAARSAEERLALSEGGIVQKTRTICVLQAAIAAAAYNIDTNKSLDSATGDLVRHLRAFIS